MVNADFTVKIGGKFLVIQSFEVCHVFMLGRQSLMCLCFIGYRGGIYLLNEYV